MCVFWSSSAAPLSGWPLLHVVSAKKREVGIMLVTPKTPRTLSVSDQLCRLTQPWCRLTIFGLVVAPQLARMSSCVR